MNVDFSELWRQVRRISDERVEIDWTAKERSISIAELERGVEIDLKHLEVTNGLLSIQGRQVLLFIPDQSYPVDDIAMNPEKGKRFHVADCSTLEKMRRINRFERYIVTNNLSGQFEISHKNQYGVLETGTAALRVCKNCLTTLNYKNYKHGGRKAKIWQGFNIAEFFETYSTHFRNLPSDFSDRLTENDYTDDWQAISFKVRSESEFRCDECRVDLSAHEHRRLLHTHHINGVRSDNRRSNLQPLCADCHRKQPLHSRMFVSADDMRTLTRLRREQRINDVADWDEAFKFADTAAHGALHYAKSLGFEAPEIGYEFIDDRSAVIGEVEAAWPDKQMAIYVSKPEKMPKNNWQLYSTIEFLERVA